MRLSYDHIPISIRVESIACITSARDAPDTDHTATARPSNGLLVTTHMTASGYRAAIAGDTTTQLKKLPPGRSPKGVKVTAEACIVATMAIAIRL